MGMVSTGVMDGVVAWDVDAMRKPPRRRPPAAHAGSHRWRWVAGTHRSGVALDNR